MPIYYSPFLYDGYFVYVLIPLIISLIAQAKVTSTFRKYSQVASVRGVTAAEVARKILDSNGQRNVAVERVSGNLTDHYDPRTNTVRLSESVYDSASVSAIGVAAHECGHAAQHAQNYLPIKIRSALVPVANLGSHLALPLVIIGLLFSASSILVDIGIWLYVGVVAFSVVTLPVEFNASRRAIKVIESSYILADGEIEGAKKVLGAAAMTYVASTFAAVMSLLRLLSIAGRRRD